MPGAVQLARSAKGLQLFGRAFDAAAFFANQVQLTAGQARRQGIEQVGSQFTGLGQEQHGAVEGHLGWLDTIVAATGKAAFEHGVIARMPCPGLGLRQLAEQAISGAPAISSGPWNSSAWRSNTSLRGSMDDAS